MRFLLCCFFAFIGCNMEAQVGVNTTSPQAQLDIRSSNQATPSNTDGILIPKIDTFPVTNPTAAQTGMLVYLTTISGANQPGFYYWDNPTTSWLPVSKNDDDWYEVGTSTPPNAITDNMFHTGNVAIGKATTTAKLDIEQTNSNIYTVRVRHTNPPNILSSSALDTEISSNQASGVISGLNNRIEPNNTVQGIGVYNAILGTTSGFLYGFRNAFANTGSGLKYGFTNSFDAGTGSSYGLYNSFNQTSTISLRGVYNGFNNTAGTGNIVGVENFFTGSGDGAVLMGVNSTFTSTSNSNMFGSYTYVPNSNSGVGNKYGFYSNIESTAGGIHYGIFAQALKNSGYAGYFLGRVAIGTTAANNYILPLTRGIASQIMQTDGAGNVTWQNPSTALNNNFWSTTGNTGLPSTAFIGNSDNVSLKFRVNNVQAGLISGDLDSKNTYLGYNSGGITTSNSNNVGIGYESLRSLNGSGLGSAFNVAVGNESLFSSIDGSFNVAVGYNALRLNTSGNSNCAIGEGALQNNVSGSYNIALGNGAGSGELGSYKLHIGSIIYGELDNEILRSNTRRFFISDPTVNGTQMLLKNSNRYQHSMDANLNFGTAGGDFLMSTAESNAETAGIRGDGNNVSIWSPGDGGRQLRILDEDAWVDNNGNPYDNAAEVAYIANNGQYFQVSDRNKKENIQKIDNALNKVSSISGYTYQYKLKSAEIEKGEKPTVSSGVLAQEIQTVLPEAVQKNESGEYFVDYAAITPLLIEAIKEQNTKIHSLEERLKQLEDKLSK